MNRPFDPRDEANTSARKAVAEVQNLLLEPINKTVVKLLSGGGGVQLQRLGSLSGLAGVVWDAERGGVAVVGTRASIEHFKALSSGHYRHSAEARLHTRIVKRPDETLPFERYDMLVPDLNSPRIAPRLPEIQRLCGVWASPQNATTLTGSFNACCYANGMLTALRNWTGLPLNLEALPHNLNLPEPAGIARPYMQKQKQLKSEGYALVFDAVPEEQCDALAGYLRKIKGWTNIPNASSTSLSSSRQMVGLNVYNKDVSPLLHTLLEEAQLSFPDFCGNSMMCDVVALRNTADAGLGHCHTDGDHAAASNFSVYDLFLIFFVAIEEGVSLKVWPFADFPERRGGCTCASGVPCAHPAGGKEMPVPKGAVCVMLANCPHAGMACTGMRVHCVLQPRHSKFPLPGNTIFPL